VGVVLSAHGDDLIGVHVRGDGAQCVGALDGAADAVLDDLQEPFGDEAADVAIQAAGAAGALSRSVR
jgi:hypothetical protein